MKVAVPAASAVAWGEAQRPAEIPRPASIDPSVWRRFSRLARLAAAALAPIVDGGVASAERGPDRRRAVLDRDEVPLFLGTGVGEFSSTFQFLRSLTLRGPAGASPLAFQNSVHNAAAGHLSIAFGLRGPSETLCAGDLTTLRTFERAMASVLATRAPALVVLADDLTDDAVAGWRHAGCAWALGEGAAAFLIAPTATDTGEDAVPLRVEGCRLAAGPMTLELVDPGPESPLHPTFRSSSDIGGTIGDDDLGTFCTVEAQLLARAVTHRFCVDLGFPLAAGTALLARLPS